jgi:mannobiose 2-epimerase
MRTDTQLLLQKMAARAGDELTSIILPYWINRMPDPSDGGFYGQIDGRDKIVPGAPKGGILNASCGASRQRT